MSHFLYTDFGGFNCGEPGSYIFLYLGEPRSKRPGEEMEKGHCRAAIVAMRYLNGDKVTSKTVSVSFWAIGWMQRHYPDSL
jgi:hypothetical protein